MLLVFISGYLILTLIIGWYSSKYVKTSQDYVLAGRKMPTFVVASGLFATWFGSETILGASSEFLDHGILGIIEDPFGAALCLLLIGLIYARPLYKLNLYTFSDYFRIRFSKKVEIISALFMIPSYFGWIAAQLIALAIILQAISGIEFYIGVILCAALVLFYTYIGGMWSISITDTIQTIMIIAGLIFLAVLFYSKSGQIKPMPENFWRFIPKENTSTSWLIYFSAWITIGWGSIPQQDVFQRVLSAKSEKSAFNGALISSIMYLSVALLPLFIALMGSQIAPGLLKDDRQMFIPNLVLQNTGLFFQIMFFGSLISAILSTCSAAMLAPATVIAENLIKPLSGNKILDQKLLKIMRLSTIFITIVSIILSFSKSSIFELVSESSALSLVALFVPLTAGLFWKKSNEMGAILSMLLGVISWIWALNYDNPYPPAVFGLFWSIFGMISGSFFQTKFLKDKQQHARQQSKQLEN
ncbi:MAG: sodium:solute symporter family protein [Spirosomataceae bacterium]|jgi:SSS family transporter